jgi:hypothetical protein
VLVWLNNLKRGLVNTNNHREINTRHAIFIPWFGQVTLAYFHVVASQWTRVALNPFQVIRWSTWIPRFFPLDDYSCLRRISTRLESLAHTTKITMKAWSKVRMSNTHKTQIAAHPRTQEKTWAQMTTQGVLDSNGAQISNTTKRMRGNRVWMP